MKLVTEKFTLKTLDSLYLYDIIEYYKKNEEFHKYSMPKKNDDFFSTEFMEFMILEEEKLQKISSFYRFYVFKTKKIGNSENQIIGDVSIYDIKFGNISSCYIGIKIDLNNINQGIASEVLQKILEFVNKDLGLHTARATILPNNKSSIRLFEKCGFEFDGLIKDLFLSDIGWLDHLHFTKIFK